MPRPLIPEMLLTEKQKKQRQYRLNQQKYQIKYRKYYYLKKILQDPNYNQKNWVKRKVKQVGNETNSKIISGSVNK